MKLSRLPASKLSMVAALVALVEPAFAQSQMPQLQWSDRAIARTTPVLLGLYALVTVWADDLHRSQAFVVRSAKWYRKTSLTFTDAIAGRSAPDLGQSIFRDISGPD